MMLGRKRIATLALLTLGLAALALNLSAQRKNAMATSRFGAGMEALESAVLADDRAGIERAVSAGANPNARDAQQVTPLMLAVDRLKQNAVAALLALGADPNAKASDGESAITLAAQNYRDAPNLVFGLIQAGGNPNITHQDGDPVIIRFVNDRSCPNIARMKALGANLDIVTASRRPLVLHASLGSDWDVVWCLLELGAKYDYPPGPPEHNLVQRLSHAYPSPDSPIYPYKVKVRDFLRAKGLPAPALPGDAVK